MCLHQQLDGPDVRQPDYEEAKVGKECQKGPHLMRSEGLQAVLRTAVPCTMHDEDRATNDRLTVAEVEESGKEVILTVELHGAARDVGTSYAQIRDRLATTRALCASKSFKCTHETRSCMAERH